MSRSIPGKLHAALLDYLASDSGDGTPPTYKEAAAWLLKEHGVKTSYMSVARVVAKHSKRGEELLATALREEFRNAIEPMRARVVRMAKLTEEAAREEPDAMNRAIALRSVTGALDTFAKVAGITASKLDVTTNGKGIATASVVVLPPLEADHDDTDDGALAAQPGRPGALPRE